MIARMGCVSDGERDNLMTIHSDYWLNTFDNNFDKRLQMEDNRKEKKANIEK